ncbi:MAG: CvpA family protein [Clostridia bacterium]|nr:CvpA family protein [Clostridia bacterium]
MGIIADILLVLILILSFSYWRKKGLVKSVWKIAALIITIVLVMFLKNPAADFVSHTQIADNLENSVSSIITIPPGGGVNIAETLKLPEFMQNEVKVATDATINTAEAIKSAAAKSLTGAIIIIGVCVALFILIRLALMVVFLIVDSATKLPLIKGANKLLGGLLGMVNVIFIVLLALAVFTMLAPTDNIVYEAIDKSYIVKFLYNNNILLKLFMR